MEITVEHKKQTLIASINISSDSNALSPYADIIEVDCNVIRKGTRQQWSMDKTYVGWFFYNLGKAIDKAGIDSKDVICHIHIKRYFEGIYGKSTFLTIPYDRIAKHLSKPSIAFTPASVL